MIKIEIPEDDLSGVDAKQRTTSPMAGAADAVIFVNLDDGAALTLGDGAELPEARHCHNL